MRVASTSKYGWLPQNSRLPMTNRRHRARLTATLSRLGTNATQL